jgi:CubicO group peptidase (beta-lactamase class C family)
MHQTRWILFGAALAVMLAAAPETRAHAQAAATPAPAAPVAAAIAPAQPAALDRAALEQKLDELLAAYAKVNDFSGTVLLASKGQALFAKGIGYANLEWQIPNTTKTKFRIGSMTKPFTSMLVMQLREQGKITLEDSVCVYVTPCPDPWKPVTIHHLLTHTSGIPAYTGIASWQQTNMVPKTIDQMVAIFRDLPLQWVPGEKYAYNNSGYFLLGLVIEKASGKKYEQALQEMILTPLGLTDTGYDWSKTIIPRRASGYSGRGASLENAAALDMQQPYAAGSLYSTVDDLLTWDQALYTDKLLPAAAKQLMWTPFKDNYAYGWIVGAPAPEIFGGHPRLGHNGGINGFSSVIVRLSDVNVTFIVLSNNDTADAGAVARDVAAVYYGQPYTMPAEHTVATIDPAVLDAYVGQYQLAPGFVVTVTREGNSVMAQATGQGKFEVFPESESTFFAKMTSLTITFVKGPDGKVTHFLLNQGGRVQTAKRIE